MIIDKKKNKIAFEDVETEDIVVELREYLAEVGGEIVKFDFTNCEDLHTAVVQVIGSYKLIYDVDFQFSEEKSAYKMALEGFSLCEDNFN